MSWSSTQDRTPWQDMTLSHVGKSTTVPLLFLWYSFTSECGLLENTFSLDTICWTIQSCLWNITLRIFLHAVVIESINHFMGIRKNVCCTFWQLVGEVECMHDKLKSAARLVLVESIRITFDVLNLGMRTNNLRGMPGKI